MAFTTLGFNEFLEGFKENFSNGNGGMIALSPFDGFIDSKTATYGTISNGTIDLENPIVFDVPGNFTVGKLILFKTSSAGQVTSFDRNTFQIVAEVTFPSGTYAFTNPGTLTVNSFEISLVNE
jgi:hypothetical protein